MSMSCRVPVALLVSLVLTACGSTAPTPGSTPSQTPQPPSTTLGAPSPSPAGPTGTPAGSGVDAAAIGRAFVQALATGDFAVAEGMCDDAMRAAAPAAKLGQLWQTFTSQYGAFQGIADVKTTEQAPYTIAAVETTFATASVALAITVTAAGLVGGLHVGAVQGASPGPSASPAAYVNPEAFAESDVTVGSAPWALPGTLSMPKGPGPFPGVVLVAGSGPEDRDETIGPNKPLRDIAWGLASAGIAVLRYDKRTLVYGVQMAQPPLSDSITVKEETVDDAVAAISLLRATPGIDSSRVYVVGHSLGGYLAPRIAAAAPGQLRGIVMLEANSRPLPELILAQVEYLASLSGSPDPSAQAQISALQAAIALAESPDLSPSTPASQLPLNVPASYWLDLRAYDAVAVAAGLTIPMLFTQGGRDYQVTEADFQGWKTGLSGHSDVTFNIYPALDHLLLAGTGPSTPAEYAVPGHVDAGLMDDLASWILNN